MDEHSVLRNWPWAVLTGVLCVLSLMDETVSQEICQGTHAPTFSGGENTKYPFGGLFVDIYNRIPCNSRVTGWQFCYFPPDDPTKTYTVELSVFEYDRPLNGILYIQKPESRYTVSMFGSTLLSGRNFCQKINLPIHKQFDVNDGDFIGVYIGAVISDNSQPFRQGDILNIIGNTTHLNDNNRIVWRDCQPSDDDNRPIYLGCSEDIADHRIQASLLMSDSGGSNGVGNEGNTQGVGDTSTISNDRIEPSLTTNKLLVTRTSVSSILSNPASMSSTTITTNKLLATRASVPSILSNPASMSSTINGLFITTAAATSIPSSPASERNNINTNSSRENVLVPAAVAGSCIIGILLILIVLALVAIIVHKRRKAKLELLRWRKERRNIRMDHFVIESELPYAASNDSPLQYEEPTPSLIISQTCNSHEEICRDTQFTNPTYDSGDCRPVSLVPGPQVLDSEQAIDKPLYSKVGISSNNNDCEIYEQIEDVHREDIISPPSHVKTMVNEKRLIKPAIPPPRESKLYEHYYKTLEEVSNEERRHSSTSNQFTSPASTENALLVQYERAKLLNIHSKEIKITAHLGAGQFGEVSQGVWKTTKINCEVAIKSFTVSKTQDMSMSRVKLLQEAIIMSQFNNPNVIHFHGMVIGKNRMMLVMELAAKGDLAHFLNSMFPDPGEILAPNTNKVLLGFCQQVAFGMYYLSSKGFVHRDLAARNILVTHDNVLKIADFGMSRDLADSDYYVSQGGKIPVKWTAPEAIHYKKYSTASDVWSYGCLLYEIWSLGQSPFRDYSNTETLSKLNTGYRLSPPPGCPRPIYDIMIRCWNPEPQERTTFRILILELLGPENKILCVPGEDLSSHRLAGNIGGPLEAGENMYPDLQSAYHQNY